MKIEDIGGQHFYYLESCYRQLWLYANKIQLEDGFEAVELGKILHEESYQREKKEIKIDGFVIDHIAKGYVHETKSSKTIKSEHETQPLYYAYVLRVRKGFDSIIGAKIHYPKIKQVVTLELTEDRIREIERKMDQITRITNQKEMPPVHSNTKLCRKCAYFEFCHI